MRVENTLLQNSGIEIVYEDNHLIVAEKPVNMLSQADNTGDPDIMSILKEYIKKRYNKPGNVFLGLVHRLDRPVGGVMVFARTSKAASRLSEQIRTRKFEKTYLAVVHGTPSERESCLEHYLEKDKAANTVKVVAPSNDVAKKAVLEYRVLDTKSELSLVEINLKTGRPHQIRVQFSYIGHPLFGDQKYGSEINKPGQQIALWSARIGFRHPTTKENLCFESRPPKKYPWALFNIE
ncbi:MAG TPA: RluA family pseudouridine synthase [Clostridiaceae bacterium]|nr:RluA family pseudouridine synthase [Clostridiaceae bacterium]